jgi:hypothetical protein
LEAVKPIKPTLRIYPPQCLEELADRGGVGLTPHAVAVDRALAAVAVVNETIDKMGSTGELKAFNRAFKEARAVDPSI